jgi:F-type H+-transporting ATPase subunit epsilon
MNTFSCSIITPDRKVFSEDVESVSVPTHQGTITILPHHAALFTSLVEGEVKVTTGKKEYFLAIGGGFMEVTNKEVSILVSRAYHADELNEKEIHAAEKAARDVLSNAKAGADRQRALAQLRRSTLELKVFKRKHLRMVNPTLQ